VSAICFEIANLEDIAQIAGLDVARRASEIVSDRLVAGIGGPHALERPDERRFLVAAPMELEAAVDLARKVMDGLSRPIVLDKMSVHVAIAAMVGNRRAIDSRLAAAA
jgi:hypothetical protein